jgi:hypothetical protein
MASTHFYYNPTTGTGNAVVSVSADTQNATTADKSATITLTNGVNSVTVNVLQKYKPYKMQGPTGIPATGGTITLTARSEYDIVFRSVPTWLTIWSGGTQVQEAQRVSLPTQTGVFTLSAGTNTGAERSAGYYGMNMSHYIGDTLYTTDAPRIDCIQYANEGIITDVAEITFNWNETAPLEFCVSANTSWTSTIEDD